MIVSDLGQATVEHCNIHKSKSGLSSFTEIQHINVEKKP